MEHSDNASRSLIGSDLRFKQECDQAYEDGTPILSDEQYDAIFGMGASAMDTNTTASVDLPVWMGSLDKAKTDKDLKQWLKRFPHVDEFVVSAKLDGVSALVHQGRLFSRGCGSKGTEWTRHMKHIPWFKKKSNWEGLTLRGELIIPKSVFQAKHATTFKNARNLVAGQMTAKAPNKNILNDIEFVPYEMIDSGLLPVQQFEKMHPRLFNLPWYKIFKRGINGDLGNLIDIWRKTCRFEMDGVVVTANHHFTRNTSGNPMYSIAFKKGNDVASATTRVKEVVWSLSRWGVLVPVIHIEPVVLCGVTISKMTGHNAKFIQDNGIGSGAEIVCIRSGDVIPKIVRVIEPVEVVLPDGEWEGVHIKPRSDQLANDPETRIIKTKTTVCLLAKMGVKHVNIKTVEKLFDQGLTDLFQIMTAPSSMQCFSGKQGQTILGELSMAKQRQHKLSCIIAASGTLGNGIGERRIDQLINSIPHFMFKRPKIDELTSVDGFSSKLGAKILESYDQMRHFVDTCISHGILFDSFSHAESSVQIPMKKICLSGFRDKTLEERFIILASVTKECDLLVVKDTNKVSSKTRMAEKYGIPIVTRESLV